MRNIVFFFIFTRGICMNNIKIRVVHRYRSKWCDFRVQLAQSRIMCFTEWIMLISLIGGGVLSNEWRVHNTPVSLYIYFYSFLFFITFMFSLWRRLQMVHVIWFETSEWVTLRSYCSTDSIHMVYYNCVFWLEGCKFNIMYHHIVARVPFCC